MEEEKPELDPLRRQELSLFLGEPVRGLGIPCFRRGQPRFPGGPPIPVPGSSKYAKRISPIFSAWRGEALETLGSTGTVTVPRVYGHTEKFLVMEDLGPEAKEAGDGDWRAFGREFGALHREKGGLLRLSLRQLPGNLEAEEYTRRGLGRFLP